LNAAQCAFGYRDSVFKHAAADNRDLGLLGRALITQVRFRLPKKWQCDVSYLDLTKKQAQHGVAQPTPQQVFDWVCEIRRAKLPDPEHLGSAGSFFKNPTVSAEQCADIIAREPKVVHYHLVDGRIKLAAGWLIDACGWRGKSVGNAAVYERQALVIVNKGGRANPCTGGEVMTLAKAIQTSVYERFGIRLEPEPVVV
jgi:UDP-N-acetylmuramate dehydrogenase